MKFFFVFIGYNVNTVNEKNTPNLKVEARRHLPFQISDVAKYIV